MKYLLSIFLFLAACNSADVENEDNDTVAVEKIVLQPEEIYAYSVDLDSMRRVANELPPEYVQVDSMIKGLNARYPDIILEKIKQSNDTLYTKIDNAEHLTQRMGSAGAEAYFANLYFNLTAVPGVRYVKVDLEEGDHAGPTLLGPNAFSQIR